jgi:hypothetical protein
VETQGGNFRVSIKRKEGKKRKKIIDGEKNKTKKSIGFY